MEHDGADGDDGGSGKEIAVRGGDDDVIIIQDQALDMMIGMMFGMMMVMIQMMRK